MTTQLGRYDLLDRIASGGMAEVWRARVRGPIGFEKDVALKRIHPHLLDRDEYLEMFAAEAKLAAKLMHPNIVQVFDFGIADGTIAPECYLAMELVDGTTLSGLQRAQPAGVHHFPLELVCYIGIEAARGLEYAHTATTDDGHPLRVIHRDVSPQNILVSAQGEVKIGDFGIAKFANAMSQTQTGIVKGKLGYMSPEQVLQKRLDHRTDIFALGIVLYELASGRTLFDAHSMVALYESVSKFQGLDESHLVDVAPALHGILRGMLHPDPNARAARAADVENDLSAVLGGDGPRARRALAERVRDAQARGPRKPARPLTGTTRLEPSGGAPPSPAPNARTETVPPGDDGPTRSGLPFGAIRWVALAVLAGVVATIALVVYQRRDRDDGSPKAGTLLALRHSNQTQRQAESRPSGGPDATLHNAVDAEPEPGDPNRAEALAPGAAPPAEGGARSDGRGRNAKDRGEAAPTTPPKHSGVSETRGGPPTPERVTRRERTMAGSERGGQGLEIDDNERVVRAKPLETTFRFGLVDASTRAPIAGADVHFCGHRFQTDARGEVREQFVVDEAFLDFGCEAQVRLEGKIVEQWKFYPAQGERVENTFRVER